VVVLIGNGGAQAAWRAGVGSHRPSARWSSQPQGVPSSSRPGPDVLDSNPGLQRPQHTAAALGHDAMAQQMRYRQTVSWPDRPTKISAPTADKA
jgi:hypothetical protein